MSEEKGKPISKEQARDALEGLRQELNGKGGLSLVVVVNIQIIEEYLLQERSFEQMRFENLHHEFRAHFEKRIDALITTSQGFKYRIEVLEGLVNP